MKWLVGVWLALSCLAHAAEPDPVWVGADLEISDATSTSDDAILLGLRTAIEEINRSGGVLNGRPIKLLVRDNRTIPARGRENIKEMLQTKDLVAVFVGKFSAIAVDQAELTNAAGLPLLTPWAASDALVDNGAPRNYVFRLSLRDSWAIQRMIRYGMARGLTRFGLLAPANAWGRSCEAAAIRAAKDNGAQLLSAQTYYWGGEKTFVQQYQEMLNAGAQAVLLVANESDGAVFIKDVARYPKARRLPIISHWGISGGRFHQVAGPALFEVDLAVVQTRNLLPARNASAARLAKVGRDFFGVTETAHIPSVPGLANSYDLMHLLARAINQARSTDRAAIATALEHLPPFEGVIRRYAPAFTPTRHEALSEQELVMARFEAGGGLRIIERP